MDVTRIDQVAIVVEDLDHSLAFYERAFGLTPTSREHIESDGVEEAMLDVGGVWLQLLQATRPDSPVARYLERHGPGLHHLGFGVGSVGDSLDHLREQEVALIDQEPRIGGGGHRIAFVHPKGTGGVLVELVEDDPDGGAAPDRPSAPPVAAAHPTAATARTARPGLDRGAGR